MIFYLSKTVINSNNMDIKPLFFRDRRTETPSGCLSWGKVEWSDVDSSPHLSHSSSLALPSAQSRVSSPDYSRPIQRTAGLSAFESRALFFFFFCGRAWHVKTHRASVFGARVRVCVCVTPSRLTGWQQAESIQSVYTASIWRVRKSCEEKVRK